MGGFGIQHINELDYKITNPLPILYITGTQDIYKPSCEYAQYFFKKRGYKTSIKILQYVDHTYPVSEEAFILEYLGIKNDIILFRTHEVVEN